MNAAFLFISTFILMLTLGLQSQFVNNWHPAIAFANSFLIGTSNLVLFQLVPDASGPEIAAYLVGGPLGILISMVLFARFTGWVGKRKCTNGGAK